MFFGSCCFQRHCNVFIYVVGRYNVGSANKQDGVSSPVVAAHCFSVVHCVSNIFKAHLAVNFVPSTSEERRVVYFPLQFIDVVKIVGREGEKLLVVVQRLTRATFWSIVQDPCRG